MPRHRTVSISDHNLQIFDSSKSMAESVASFLLAGFRRGEPLLVAATPKHRELITQKLEEAGVNIRQAVMASRLVLLDAAQTLEKIMRQDIPSRIAFEEIAGTLVAQLAKQGRLCIYGEMVDVLAARGQYKAAYQLEVLWSELGKREPFTLFCGYSSAHFSDPKTATILGKICETHSRVHRKKDDLLAEALLERQDARGPRGSTGS
jgi:MEDS: MEthanogen/methylotroph, DcmR Sensory domain